VAEAASAELVLLAVPWLQVEAALTGLPSWNGRILVDATNPFVATAPKLVLAELGDTGASEIVARLAPGARLVKAFNSIRMVHYDVGPRVGAARRVLFVSGDDPEAKSQVAGLIESFGFAAIDLGDLVAGGRLQQAGGPLAGHDLLLAM
jgi:8-hydroxy-5-deazaflavin:NADPH oxidoreductase